VPRPRPRLRKASPATRAPGPTSSTTTGPGRIGASTFSRPIPAWTLGRTPARRSDAATFWAD
jgi:hypothetical protein